jgi:DNA (cytosine-5)-methyltransferase 1
VQLTLFDQIGFSLKTAPESEPKAGTSSSVNLWRVDIPGETESLGRLMSERHTNEIDGGALQNVPTPTVCGNYNRKGASKTSGDGLATFVKKWPTPTRGDYRSGKAELNENGIRISKTNGIAHCTCLAEMVFHRETQKDIGTLSPEWTEWLQGFPIGHTELKHSEMHKSRSARQ